MVTVDDSGISNKVMDNHLRLRIHHVPQLHLSKNFLGGYLLARALRGAIQDPTDESNPQSAEEVALK